jgi:hypothetical protein
MSSRHIEKTATRSNVTLPSISQGKQAEPGRYLLQVDRQTKGSYATEAAARSAAMAIKKKYPVLQVNVYDAIEHANNLISLEASAA